jgi:peptidoglycan biosynthesis protein MviN/MurJ (putative lipid II flippase)
LSQPEPDVVAERRILRSETSVPQSSVIVSVSLLLSALIGAAQGLLLVFIVGEGDDVDAFLAAYSLYVVFAIFGGSLRASIVPVLGAHVSDAPFRERATEVLSRVLLMGLVVIAGFVAISVPAGQLLTLGLPAADRWTAVFTLLLLAPAAFTQIYSAAQAAVLVGARRFAVSATLYVVSGAVALGLSAALLALIGVLGAAVGLLVGGIANAAGHSVYIRSFGVHPRPQRARLRDRRQRELAIVLVSAASLAVALQLDLAIALASVSNDPGAITAYSYAYFLVGLALAISSFPLGLVTIPELVEDYARRGREATREYITRIAPYAFAVLAPTIAAFAICGKPVLELVFEDSLSDHAIDVIYGAGVALGVSTVPQTLLFLTASVALAIGRARVFLVLSFVTLAIQAALVLPLSSWSPVAVAVGHTIALALTAVILMRVIFGSGWAGIALVALVRSSPAFALSGVFILARLPFGADLGALEAIVAALAGLVAYAGGAMLLWRDVSAAFLGLLRRPGSASGDPAPRMPT